MGQEEQRKPSVILRRFVAALVVVQICITIAFIAMTFYFALQNPGGVSSSGYQTLARVQFGVTLVLQIWCLVKLWQSSGSVLRKSVWTAGIVLIGFLVAPAYYFYLFRSNTT